MRKFYRFKDGVYEFDSNGSQDDFITSDYVPMSNDEIDRHIYPEKYMSEGEKYALYLKSLKPLARRQFRMVLVLNGYDLDEIKAQILEIADTHTRQLTLIEWEDASTFERTSSSLLMMAKLLELSDEQVDAMWEHALTL